MMFKDASTVEKQLLIEWVHMQYVSRIDTAKKVRPLVIETNLPSTFDSVLHSIVLLHRHAIKLKLLPDFAKQEREPCLVVATPFSLKQQTTLCQCELNKKYMTRRAATRCTSTRRDACSVN